MNDAKVFYVKKLRLLSYLLQKGFTEYTVIPDPTSHKGYNWFMFERTPEFDIALDEYFARFK